jgi:hypothetical protein
MVCRTDFLDFSDGSTSTGMADDGTLMLFVTGPSSKIVDSTGKEHTSISCRKINLVTGECWVMRLLPDGRPDIDMGDVRERLVQLPPPLRVVDADGNEFVPKNKINFREFF